MENKASKESFIKSAASGAEKFIESYYDALNSKRRSLESFYSPDASIVWNGNPLTGGSQFARFFERMPAANYDVQSFDAHPMLPNQQGLCNYLLIVSGSVKYGESKEQRGFSETFVLKPNPDAANRYVVSTQGFRLVV